MSNTDEDLYSQLPISPEKTFRALYDRYSGPLFRFVFRFTANNETTEEILHDIFLQLLAGKYSPHDGSTLKSWLYTVAKNKSLNHLKKSSFEVKNNEVIDNTSSDFDLVEHFVGENLLQRLAFAETQMPTDLKEIWSLRKQGFDYQQIANELSIPVGTVKSRFSRLVSHLRKEFKNEL